MDIIKGFGNANKLMNRLLAAVQEHLSIAEISGGSLRNAIPRESVAVVVVPTEDISAFVATMDAIQFHIIEEYKLLELDLSISTEKVDRPKKVLSKKDQSTLIKAIYAAHNGVYRMSPAIEDLVETSNNIAKVTVKEGKIKIECLTRSSVESSKDDLAQTLTAVFELAGYTVTTSGSYPGWAPNMESPILKVLDGLYEKLNGNKAHVAACHAGLECGILGQNYPEMDMISFGPTIKGAHSPDERASISSTQKYWEFVLEILKNIPKK
jgi:dipeptidase D